MSSVDSAIDLYCADTADWLILVGYIGLVELNSFGILVRRQCRVAIVLEHLDLVHVHA